MIFSYLLNMQSHPSWVCGLKHRGTTPDASSEWSHPSWVCGLKLYNCTYIICLTLSHPSWVCGLKPYPVGAVWYLVGHTLRGCVD